MLHPTIIHDLAIVTFCGAIVAMVFQYFRLPVIVGYLLAGLIVGPNTFYHSLVYNESTIREISELGVIFLMFYIGLEFDLRKLKQVMSAAFSAVFLQTLVMILLGILSAPILKWSRINGLFLGGILAISSTMVTFSVLRDQNALKKTHAQMAIGMLILEDIVAILLLVILTGLAATGELVWAAIWQNIFLVGVFVMMVFYLGKLIVPSVLRLLQRFGNAELLVLVAVGLVLGVGMVAEQFKFSIALGAFMAGAILSQSSLAKEIENATEPLRNLFNAIFFVTVGMLIEPYSLLNAWLPILIIALLVISGKITTVIFGLFLTGQNSKVSFQAAMCKSQVGEFSFIIATLGKELGVADSSLNTFAVGIALITILLTPILNAHSNTIFNHLAYCIPDPIVKFIKIYKNILNTIKNRLSKNIFISSVRKPLLKILGYFLLFNGVIGIAYIVASYIKEQNILYKYIAWLNLIIWLIAALLSLPFLATVIRNLDKILVLVTEATFFLKILKYFKSERIRIILHNFLLCMISILFGSIYLSAAATYFPKGLALNGFLILIITISSFCWKTIIKLNSKLEAIFLESLSREVHSVEYNRQQKIIKKISSKHPWPITLKQIVIKPGTIGCGRRITDLRVRSDSGASIVGMNRNTFIIYYPSPETCLLPEDCLFLTGNHKQFKKAQKIFSQKENKAIFNQECIDIQWEKIYINSNSPIIGETLASANLRNKYCINIISIQSNHIRIVSPKPSYIISAGDFIVVAGSTINLNKFKQKNIKTTIF